MEFKDCGPFVLKITYYDAKGHDNVMAIKYNDYEQGLEFSSLISYIFGDGARTSYMSEREYIQQAWERDELWLLEIVSDVGDDINVDFDPPQE